MGTLDPTPSNSVNRVSKVINIDGKPMPQVKIALDEWLQRGWRLVAIYNEAAETRAVFIKDKE